jgi:hypothetical protein
MSAAKHHPGEWSVLEHDDRVFVLADGAMQIAEVTYVLEFAREHGSRRLQNARVMAAAPELLDVREGNQQEAVNSLSFYSGDMDKGRDPWTRVGEADITVRLFSRDEMVTSQLRTLQSELNEARAEWLTKQKALLEQINKLQALTNEVAA